MSKHAEQTYVAMLGEAGRTHLLGKPFTNIDCGLTLTSIGSVMSLAPPPPGMVLDLGCGSGWTSVFMAKRGYHVVGQDISADMIALAQECQRAARIGQELTFIQSDYENLGFTDLFDCALFFDSLHHAEDPAAAVRSAYQALKPGGVMITHEPGKGHSTAPWSVEAMELYGVNEKDMPPHLIMQYGRDAGFREFSIFPMQHDLLELFYAPQRRRLLSRKGLAAARRALSMLFRPSLSAGSIVVSRK